MGLKNLHYNSNSKIYQKKKEAVVTVATCAKTERREEATDRERERARQKNKERKTAGE